MYKILLATDGSEHSGKVIDEGLLIADALKAEVTIVTVVGEYVFTPGVSVHFGDGSWDRINTHLREEAEEVVQKAAAPFREKGLTANTEIILGHKSPAEAICEMAGKGDYNLVIVGSRGLRGIKEMFLGSVSNALAHCVSTSILIVK
jgi:nucleotide-binding universal stress UspA family protein